MRPLTLILGICLLLAATHRARAADQIVGIHLLSWTSDSLLVELGKTITTLADQGINLIFLEVDYSFEFESHPELSPGITAPHPAGRTTLRRDL